MRRLEAATSMVLLLMSIILTVQKGVLGTMITNLAVNKKKKKLTKPATISIFDAKYQVNQQEYILPIVL